MTAGESDPPTAMQFVENYTTASPFMHTYIIQTN